MGADIYVCLDLGNDTLKISFAYTDGVSDTLGKLNNSEQINQIALPAAAYYDAEYEKWYFADELASVGGKNLSTVVKIKSLLSLVVKNRDKQIEAQNLNYYQYGHYFPTFAFPVRRRHESDFQYLVDHQLVFSDPQNTPQHICQAFFVHIRNKIQELVDDLSSKTDTVFNSIQSISVVHPPKQGEAYVEEMSRLIEYAFGFAPGKVLTSTQALGIFAFHQGLIAPEERVLLFDLGDEVLSVCKAWFGEIGHNKNQNRLGLIVDSAHGHIPQVDVGGSNIDEDIMAFLESAIHERETVGSPSPGQEGHIYEDGLCADQYRMMKDIKKAKMVMPMVGKGIFRDGVPITVHREALVQRLLTEDAFAMCVGMKQSVGVARHIRDYICQELHLPASRDVRKVLLAGGVVETKGLLEYLREELRGEDVELLTFTSDFDDNISFHIQQNEMSTYAASVGGAIVAMKNYSVDAVLSYSYGTWMYHRSGDSSKKHLQLFANRGDVLEDGMNRFAMGGVINLDKSDLKLLDGDELFSTIISTEEMERMCYSDKVTYDGKWLVVGEDGDPDRIAARDAIDLRVIAGGSGTEILFFYRDNRVYLFADEECVIHFEEGFMVDKNGVATPFFSNDTAKNVMSIYVRYARTGKVECVSASEIEFRLTMNSVDVTTNT